MTCEAFFTDKGCCMADVSLHRRRVELRLGYSRLASPRVSSINILRLPPLSTPPATATTTTTNQSLPYLCHRHPFTTTRTPHIYLPTNNTPHSSHVARHTRLPHKHSRVSSHSTAPRLTACGLSRNALEDITLVAGSRYLQWPNC